MDYVIKNPTPEQLLVIADCEPHAVVITHDNRVVWLSAVARFYNREFESWARHLSEEPLGDLIPWESLSDDQREYLAADLIRVNPFTEEYEVVSDFADASDVADYFDEPRDGDPA